MLKTSLLFVLFTYLLLAQDISQISLIEDEISQSIPSYNHQGTIYISVKHFSDALKLDSNFSDSGSTFEIAFHEVTLRFTLKNPYVVITSKVSEESTIHQLPTSSHIIDNFIFVPLYETIEIFNKYFDKSLAVISPGKVIVLAKDQQEITKIQSVTLDHSNKGTFVHIKTNFELTSQLIP